MYNFDHPNARDFDECYEALVGLLNGKDIDVPCYNFTTHSREEES